jgi:P-type E1-E2 ATPase
LGIETILRQRLATSILLGEHLAGALVVLMLSGGEALEGFAVAGDSSVLRALARRMPSAAHRQIEAQIVEVPLQEIAIGDALLVFPHEICPVDGVVVEGHRMMDESYLTGEPFQMSKTAGSQVLSGSMNGNQGR